MITESQIENLFDQFQENTSRQEMLYEEFFKEQPHCCLWILEGHQEVLTENEQDLLYFLSLFIWQCFSKFRNKVPEIQAEEIAEAEEVTWSLIEGHEKKSWAEKLNLLFEHCPEPELLAFVEDALVEDPEDQDLVVTAIGKEPVLVALFSLIYCFDKAV